MANCLISPAQEIGKCILTLCLWPPIKPHFDYWWRFDNNIQKLSDGIRELERQIFDLTRKIEEARLRCEVVRPGVEEWLKESTEKLAEAQSILPGDNIPNACNLLSRYSLGKNANKTAEEIAKLRNNGNFNPISDPAPPPATASPYYRPTMEFESRKSIEKNVIDSLKEISLGLIGICGIGGVGKTTMAQRIGKRVKEENLFDEIVPVTVSQNIDEFKIQEDIAEWLGLRLDGKGVTRATTLRTRLMDAKRKIIILDDVWESLRFEDLGIPIEGKSERCKVLLTSRSRDACKRIKNKKVFELKILEEEEAWILFKEQVGECIEDLALLPLAKDVAAECKGLPIALVTVGMALQDERNERTWKHSLSKLKEAKPTDLPKEIMTHVYLSLELSYEKLDNDLEKRFFLLCCLFPEDYNIPIEELTWCCMGLQMFDNMSIEKATNKTQALVGKLKSRFLLMDGWHKHVKMHDVIRDVAIYIGSKEKNGFLKSLTSVKNSSDVNCNWMSVDISMEVPVLSRFPKLRLLMLQKSKSSSNELSYISFEGMMELNVLSFERALIGSLPPTLGSLEKLQTLRLFKCEVKNISVIGELTSLKILSCCGCENITELPEEIGRLSGLRLLDLNGCRGLQRIPFGVISSLRRLEELKMRESFREWEAEEKGKERRNASLTELGFLPNLSCLEIEIDDCTLSAQEICLSLNLVKYYIIIGVNGQFYFPQKDYEKVMMVNFPSHIGAVGKWIQMQAMNTECLYLQGDGSVSNNFNIAEIENLRCLIVEKCSTLKKLVETKDCKFHNLKSIGIISCPKLKSLFSVSAARSCLLQLEVLSVFFCESMEQVLWNEGTDDNTDGCIIEFPKLKELTLWNLPNLTAFCQGLENIIIIIKFPNLTHMKIGGLPKLNSLSPLNSETLHDHTTSSLHFVCNNPKVEIGCLKDLTIKNTGDNIRNIWCHQIPNKVFNNLERLYISYMNGIRSLMSTSIAKNLVNLNYLSIRECEEMVEVIERDDDDKQVADINCLFPNLRQLWIDNLPKLIWFWQWNHALELPLLEYVTISKCPVMEAFTLGSINTPNITGINYKKIDNKKNLNDAIRHIWIESQNKDKVKNGDVDEEESRDENENKDEDGYEEENKDDQDHVRIESEEDEDNFQHQIGEVSLKRNKESQDTSKADGDRNGTENENEDKDESKNENVNKDEDSNEKK